MTKMSLTVKEYAQAYISTEHRERFYNLMRDWDGCPGWSNAFYDFDVLEMKQKEAETYEYY